MKFGKTPAFFLLSIGAAFTLAQACSSGGGSASSTSIGASTGSTGSGTGGGAGTGAGGSVGSSTSVGTTTGISTTTGIMTTGTTGAGGGRADPDAACMAQSSGTTSVPTDIFIMEDKSSSMNCSASDAACTGGMGTPPTRWNAFVGAINGFVNDPTTAGIGVGLDFFPAAGTNVPIGCDPNSYSTPTVPIAPLPDNAMALRNAVMMETPGGGTPTVPALTGAIAYARQYTMMTPGRTAAVVFVSDGIPQFACTNNTIPAAVTLVQQAYQGMGGPPIKTYVVGIGDVAALDEIAHAGSGVAPGMACPWSPPGTTECYFNAQGTDVNARLVAALKTISGMISCEYAIPMMNVDPRLVNVRIQIGMAGMLVEVGKVADMSACGNQLGWYYDNSAMPTRIVLCPAACDQAKMAAGSKVEVLYGCPSQPPR